MYSFELLLTIGLSTTVAGILIGYLISQRNSDSGQAQRQLENHLSEMQQQQENYQHEVSEHFEETAQLLNQLTNSYSDVHNHLAKGAQLLANENASVKLKKISDHSEEVITEPANDNISPPLDYAPKTAPNEPGMLNEEFGLDKAKREQEINDMVAAEDRM